MKKILIGLILLLSPAIVHGAFIQATSTIQLTGSGPTSTIAMTNLTVGDTVLISCSASIGGSNFQATSGNHIYVSSTQPSDNFILDRFQSGSTFLGQWTWRATVHNATTTYYCYNSQGFLGYVYMALSEFSDGLVVVSSTSKSAVSQTSDAGVLDSGSVGDLAYMVHMQDFFATQSPTVTDNAFVSSTDIEYSGQSRQIVYYDYRASTGQVTTTVSGWNYNDQYIASAIRYLVTASPSSSPSTTLTLIFPPSVTPDFSNWVVNVSNTSPAINQIRVYYSNISSSSFDWVDTATYGYGVSANPLSIYKTHTLLSPQGTSSSWYALATAYNVSGTLIAESPVISFEVRSDYSLPNTPINNQGGPTNGNQVASSTEYCIYPTNILDIGGGMSYAFCVAGQKLFSYQAGGLDFLTDKWNYFKTIFPFNIAFNLASTTQDYMISVGASSSRDLYLPETLGSQTIQIPLLTSTTLEMAVGSTTKRFIFSTEENILWLGTAAFLLYIAFGH